MSHKPFDPPKKLARKIGVSLRGLFRMMTFTPANHDFLIEQEMRRPGYLATMSKVMNHPELNKASFSSINAPMLIYVFGVIIPLSATVAWPLFPLMWLVYPAMLWRHRRIHNGRYFDNLRKKADYRRRQHQKKLKKGLEKR